MRKTLYSLMLSDDVIREIDIIAHLRGTNRSNLVNQILADYASVSTPESRINEIFGQMEQMMNETRELVPFFTPNQPSISLKSSLEYKYRPTVRYEVTLSRDGNGADGELAVIFRTQSHELLAAMTEFFGIWRQTEDSYLDNRAEYALYDGRFVRSIRLQKPKPGEKQPIAAALSDYIRLFDGLMKDYLCGRATARDISAKYADYLNKCKMVI